MTVRRQTTKEIGLKSKEMEELLDKVKVLKKYSERQKEEKDRAKKKLKEADH